MTTVELHETQLAFLDRLVEQGNHGSGRDEALRAVLLAHVADRLRGADAYVGGTVRRDVLEAAAPSYGERRFHHRLEPVSGRAFPVRRGEVLCIEQAVGGICVDFNAFNLHDHKETLSCGFTRGFQSFSPGRGEFIWSNAPRGRPMFAILEIAETCELDIVGHRCNPVFQELGWRMGPHPNCQDTLAEAIREYGLTPDDVHDSFNLWMATTIDEHGRRRFRWNPARKGDRIALLALFDVLAVPAICGNGDLVGINNYTFHPVDTEVLGATASTVELADRVEERWGRLASQRTSADLASVPLPAARALDRDAAYVPRYHPVPPITGVEVGLGAAERALLRGLIATDVYGETEGEALRAAFMRWCNAHRNTVRRPFVELREPA
jgi:uncharacterized protein YcgI (DUF1989 family)